MAAFGLLAASAVAWMAWLCVLAVLYIQGADTFLAIAGFSYNLVSVVPLSSSTLLFTASHEKRMYIQIQTCKLLCVCLLLLAACLYASHRSHGPGH